MTQHRNENPNFTSRMPEKHTPTPWRLEAESGIGMISAGDAFAIHDFDIYSDVQLANAEFIVRAVNSHGELLELVKEFTTMPNIEVGFKERCTKAIEKAEKAL